MPRLENWSIKGEFNPYQAPELRIRELSGEIYDDEAKRFKDETEILTSTIIKCDFENNTAQTKSREYKLGKKYLMII